MPEFYRRLRTSVYSMIPTDGVAWVSAKRANWLGQLEISKPSARRRISTHFHLMGSPGHLTLLSLVRGTSGGFLPLTMIRAVSTYSGPGMRGAAHQDLKPSLQPGHCA